MSTSPAPAGRLADSRTAPPPRAGVPRPEEARAAPLLRRVGIAWLSPSGQVEEIARLVPGVPAFEEAFAAFARGTLFPAPRGYVAVEDLWPGMEVRTAEGTLAQVLWRGSTMVVPGREGQDPAMTRLTRLPAEALGWGKPFEDLVLGPCARVVSRRPGIRLLTGREAALIPAADLVDGMTAVEVTPGAAVEVFHLGFARHERLLANGVEVESQHPGPLHAFPLRGDRLASYLACFPHRADFSAFGEPALPRLRLRDLDLFSAA